MPRVSPDYVPAYRIHKPTGRAVVTLSGREHPLGRHGTSESKAKYYELISRWIQNGRRPLDPGEVVHPDALESSLTVASLLDAHERHAHAYYLDANGRPTTEIRNFAAAVAPLREVFGPTLAAEFSPTKLRAVRDRMITKGWARTLINKHVNRIRSIWKWAAGEELLPATVHLGLTMLQALKRGRTKARESTPVAPVPIAHVEAIEQHVSPAVWGLIQLQRFTGARGGELFKLRAIDIDTTGLVWTYRPVHHKTAHHGHQRTIYFGPKAQTVLSASMAGKPVDRFLFCPRESNAARKAESAAKGKRRRQNQRPNPRKTSRRIREHYDAESYRRAIKRGCDLASPPIPHWHPHQLRHTAATLWRKNYGPDGALLMLGDKTTRMVDVYAEKDHEQAMRIAAELG